MLSAESSTRSLRVNTQSPDINDAVHPPADTGVASKAGRLSIPADDLDEKEEDSSTLSASSGLPNKPHSERNSSPAPTTNENVIHTLLHKAPTKNHTQHSPINVKGNNDDMRKQIHPCNAHAFQALTSAPSSELNHADSAVRDASSPPESGKNRDSARVVSPTSRAAASHQGDAQLQGQQSLLEKTGSTVQVLGEPIGFYQKRKFDETATNSSGDEGVHEESTRQNNHDELPLDVRNKKMKATDCLLFAATLLEDDSKAAGDQQELENLDGHAQGHQIALSSSFASDSGRETDTPTIGSANGPRDVDVLCGRGGLINKHPGNIVYRKIVDHNKPFYQSVHKKHRILVSQSIVQSIVNFGGRFMTMEKGKVWTEIGYKRAVQKTSQALRERPSPDENGGNEEDLSEMQQLEQEEATCRLEDDSHYFSV